MPQTRLVGLLASGFSISALIISCQYAAVDRLERAIEAIQASIESQGGGLIVKMKVRLARFPCVYDISHNLMCALVAQGCFRDRRTRSCSAACTSCAGECRSIRRRRRRGVDADLFLLAELSYEEMNSPLSRLVTTRYTVSCAMS